MRAWAGSCLLTSPLEEKVCASREEDDLGTRMRAAAPLQVKLAGEGEGSKRVELSLLLLSSTPTNLAGMLPRAISLEGKPGGPKTIVDRGKKWERD